MNCSVINSDVTAPVDFECASSHISEHSLRRGFADKHSWLGCLRWVASLSDIQYHFLTRLPRLDSLESSEGEINVSVGEDSFALLNIWQAYMTYPIFNHYKKRSSVSFIISASLKENSCVNRQYKASKLSGFLCPEKSNCRELRSSLTRPSIRDTRQVFLLNSNACTWRTWLITPYSRLEGLRALPCIINQKLSYRKLRRTAHV